MRVKSKSSIAMVGLIIIATVIISIYFGGNNSIPMKEPNVKIKYEGKEVSTAKGEHIWSGKAPSGQNVGNSYLSEPADIIGQALASTLAQANDTIEIVFDSKPNKMIFKYGTESDEDIKDTIKYDSSKKYEVILPGEPGEYIFEIIGYWDDVNTTSTVCKMSISK